MTTWLSTSELADRWGLPQETLRTWRHRGQGPAPEYMKHTNRVFYRLAEVKKYERRHKLGAYRGTTE